MMMIDDEKLDQGEALLALGVETLANSCKHWGVSFRGDKSVVRGSPDIDRGTRPMNPSNG